MIKFNKMISGFHQKSSERITDGLFLEVSIFSWTCPRFSAFMFDPIFTKLTSKEDMH